MSSEDRTHLVAPVRASDSSVQWAMVIPKLSPPVAAIRALPAASSEAAHFAAPKYLAPKFEVSTDSASIAVKFLLIASLALLVIPGWNNDGSAGARAVEMESGMGGRGWLRSSGLVLYRPSMGKADYRMEFTWKIDSSGLAWVVRAKDNASYYAVRLKPVGPELGRRITVERFARYGGVEKSRSVKTVALSRPDVRIRTEVAGSTFKLYLDGNLVSQWMDSRLATGGVGFLGEPNQNPRVESFNFRIAAVAP